MLRTTESLYDQGSNCCLSAGASCVCSKYQIILLLSFDIFAPISMQSPFGMSHQQALAQVTAQATFSQPHMFMHAEYQPSSLEASMESVAQDPSFIADATTRQQVPPFPSEAKSSMNESSEVSHSDRKSQPPSLALDKPGDDGYNWRKYGQKQVKGSEQKLETLKELKKNCSFAH